MVERMGNPEFVRERHAQLVEQMLQWPQWKDKSWVKLALTIAARAIRRGRHLSDSERMDSITKFLDEEGAEMVRKEAGIR
jgi:hypothetical protein